MQKLCHISETISQTVPAVFLSNPATGIQSKGKTAIAVTHDDRWFHVADRVADRVIFLHEGVIHEEGTPDEVLRTPTQARTTAFLAGFSHFNIPHLDV